MTFKDLTPEQQKEITDKLIEFGYKKSESELLKYKKDYSYILFNNMIFGIIEVEKDRIIISSICANIVIFIRKTGISIS